MAGQTAHLAALPAVPLLVGRDRELASLRAALAAALAGQGALVLIGGEAGIGKTALAEALLAEAMVQGARALVGRCYDLSETPPYGPWREALARAPRDDGLPPAPDLAGGGVAASQVALFAGVRDYVAALAASQPLAILLDDLHWADPASLDLLRVVARSLAEFPIFLLATHRADEATSRHPLYRLLPLLLREGPTTPLTLSPLAEDDTRALVTTRYWFAAADAARLVGHLHAHAQGNPFYIRELLRGLEDDHLIHPGATGWLLGDLSRVQVPGLLRQVIGARVDRLGEAARHLLALAAVIGQEVPLALWAAVAGIDEDGLLETIEPAVEARLLAESPDGAAVRFDHALVREALYDGTLATRRRRVHRRVGEALAATATPDPDVVAYHFQQAGDARAGAWLIRAGERAERAYAWMTAADRFEAAAGLVAGTGTDAHQSGRLLFRAGRLRRYADPRQALVALERVARLTETSGDRILAAHTAFQQGILHCMIEDLAAGIAAMQAGAAALDTLPPPDEVQRGALDAMGLPQRGLPHGPLVLWLALTGRFAEADRLWEHIVARQSAQLTDERQAAAQAGLAYFRASMGEPDAARRLLLDARRAYRAVDHRSQVAMVALDELVWVALPYAAEHLAARRGLAAEAAEQWQRAGGIRADPLPRRAYLPLLLLEGAWDEARALAEAMRASDQRVFAASILGWVAREQGDRALAWALVREVLPQGAATEPGATRYFEALLLQRLGAALALDEGDLPVARTWLAAHDHWLSWSGATLGRAEGALGWAAYHRAAGDLAAARAYAERALADATEPRQPLALLAAHRALGELATTVGHQADATRHLEAALALAEACAAPYERVLALLALAESRAASGRAEDVATLLAEVRAICTPLGAAPALARADALMAMLDSASLRPVPRPDGLTAREVEVLRLYAADLPYRAIAARLSIAPRTVGTHITSIFGKTGVASRLAAATYAARHGLT